MFRNHAHKVVLALSLIAAAGSFVPAAQPTDAAPVSGDTSATRPKGCYHETHSHSPHSLIAPAERSSARSQSGTQLLSRTVLQC